jgi:hypothetical protein
MEFIVVTDDFPTAKLSPPDPRLGSPTALAEFGKAIERAETKLNNKARESSERETRTPTLVISLVAMTVIYLNVVIESIYRVRRMG